MADDGSSASSVLHQDDQLLPTWRHTAAEGVRSGYQNLLPYRLKQFCGQSTDPNMVFVDWLVAPPKENKYKQTLETDATCCICGHGTENEYHAVVTCTKSRGLRSTMREVWYLPPEKKFRYTGDNWLQVLLDSENEDTRAKILLLLWRCWHLREDCIRNDGRQTISSSVQFLEQYEEEFRLAGSCCCPVGRTSDHWQSCP